MKNILGQQFYTLIGNLIKGNTTRAKTIALSYAQQIDADGLEIVSEDLIEKMASAQAGKNALVNSPSIFPGIGTLIAFFLLSAENFIQLDQTVTLVLALLFLHKVPMDANETVQNHVIHVIGKVYHLTPDTPAKESQDITQSYMTSVLPQRYINKGLNRGINHLGTRLFPLKRRSRLLPAGIGLVSTMIYGYETTVRTGRITLEMIKGL
ncbi:MAG: hypothetical protein U9P80_09065 [Thermodesulfobacteriota bacterium]|nr:hypothetical protein [Thermodesulfobacteriota bacterium]